MDADEICSSAWPAVGVSCSLICATALLMFSIVVRTSSAAGSSASTLARLDEPRRQHRAEATGYLERVAERLRGQGLTAQVHVGTGAQPAAVILDAARDRQVDLIALETRGHRGLARLVLGSVADKVVRGAQTPVLIHSPRGT